MAILPQDESEAMIFGDILAQLSCSDKTADRVLKDLVKSEAVLKKAARTANNRQTAAYWRPSAQ